MAVFHLPALAAQIDFGLHPYWYLGRAGGLVAYTVLVISMLLGVAISSRLFDGLLSRGWFFELHKFLSIFVVAAVLFHAFIMLPDPYANFSADELLVPFRSHLQPLPLALGIIALYGLAIVSLSFYLTRWIGQKGWRAIHYLTFPVYLLGLVHGIWAGTDSDLIEARYFYFGTGVALLFFVLYRILALRSQKRSEVKRQPAARPAIDGRPSAAT
jgi:predicted ferric reductase